VRATLEPVNASPDDWSLGAIAPDADQLLVFHRVRRTPDHMRLLLDYRDLSEITTRAQSSSLAAQTATSSTTRAFIATTR
jgi:hypothetical protein